jgi:hypothetical protein
MNRHAVIAFTVVLWSLLGVALGLSLTRGPYLQNATPTSMIIVWLTDSAGTSEVEYGETASYGSSVTDSNVVTQHAVTLSGLSPYTLYHYRVKTDGTVLSSDATFRTAADASRDSFVFAAMGDHRNNPSAHLSVVQRVIAINPDLCVDTGDLVGNGDNAGDWDPQFFTPEAGLMKSVCLFPAIGNHEGTAANYLAYFYLPTGSGSERYYSFDYGNAHFVALDTNISYSAGSAQYIWFVNDITSTTKPWRFVYFHHPPYSSSSHGSDLTVRAQLCPVIEANGVQIVFNGHDHDYERSYVNGVYYIVTGGGGAPLYAAGSSSWTQASASAFHCCKITISGNNLSFEAIKPDGSSIDSFTTSTSAPDWHLY